MNIDEYADVLNLDLEIRRYANQGNRYTAHFDHCDTKEGVDDPCVTGTYGNGRNPAEAVQDYIDKIRGKILVVYAGNSEKRRQYLVPDTLAAR